jgi:tetratricopeptide (TPR) repeat protein
LDKAIEIKRRAQRCIQNGDLDGALGEYEKLVALQDSDPYNLVLLADLLFKKGDTGSAGQRYLAATGAYEKAGLYKNAIAVCKKLMRLQLAPAQVYQRLAALHALDGLSTEASLYYQQHAENLAREEKYAEAAESLRLAFEVSSENVKALERLAEVQVLLDRPQEAAATLLKASEEYGRAGQLADGERCRKRARQLDASTGEERLAELDDVAAPAPGAPPQAPATVDTRAAPMSVERNVPPGTAPRPARLPTAGPTAPEKVERVEIETARDRLSLSSNTPDTGIHASETEEEGIAAAESAASPTRSPAAGAPPTPPVLPSAARTEPEEESDAPAPAKAKERVSAAPPPITQGARDEPRRSGPPPLTKAVAAPPRAPGADESPATHPPTPGLQLQPQAAAEESGAPSLAQVERMLSRAQECFRAGQREAAGEALAGAALAYDALGRFDSAATIYRSLGKSAHATTDMLERWLENCERRGDGAEAAQVACELGDRALNDGRTADARHWFERARELDPKNDVSVRRLQRISGGGPAPAPGKPRPAGAPPASSPSKPAAPVPAPPSGRGADPGSEPGKVEVAVGRGEAVTFDLGSLISEFQRGVESQLSGDAQSHYDLGMSYREMGLLEQAVDSFRVAALDPSYALRSLEMVGRCLLDQGRFEEAIEEFGQALAQDGLDAAARLNLHYELGLAHEGCGRPDLALAEFEIVHAERPDFPDLAIKLRALRKSQGSR